MRCRAALAYPRATVLQTALVWTCIRMHGALETDLLGLVVVGVEVDGRSWSHVINACIACLHATVLQTA
eukprot:COSAG02_NODE_7601_length_2940_cov_2.219366_4_plen_68_part_01